MSAMGTVFTTYKLDNATKHMTPAEIPSLNKDTIQDSVLQSWWQYGFLDAAGEAKFLEIVEDVKAMFFNI